MTNGEIVSMIVGIAGPIATAVRWSAGIVRDALKDGQEVTKRNTDALLAFVKTATTLEAKLVETHNAAVSSAAVVQEVADEISANHEAADLTPLERPTPIERPLGGAYAVHRFPRRRSEPGTR